MKKYLLPGNQLELYLGWTPVLNIKSPASLMISLNIYTCLFRSSHVAFIYLRRLMPTLAMRIIEARAIKGFSTRVRYMIDNIFV